MYSLENAGPQRFLLPKTDSEFFRVVKATATSIVQETAVLSCLVIFAGRALYFPAYRLKGGLTMIRVRHALIVMLALLFASSIIRLAAQGVSKDLAKLSSTAELERLKFYIGDWDYSEIYEKSARFPNGGRNTGRWTAHVGPQGRSIVHAFVSHGTGENYEGIEVMTWDPKEKVYRDHSLWYDSPDQWTYVGRFEGDTLVYRGEVELDGKHVRFRSETRSRQGGGFTLDEFMSIDGGPEQATLHATAVPRRGTAKGNSSTRRNSSE